jgi:AraC-like DNA-binding protein
VAELSDRRLPLEALFGAQGQALAASSRSWRSVEQAIEQVEPFLRERRPALTMQVREIRDLVEQLAADPSLTRVHEAAERAGLGMRTLQRRFASLVGVSPKWVIRRYRLQEAAERLRDAQPSAAVAAELGYTDQPHFVRDFRAQVGRTPAAFAKTTRR